jgi:hypothetical protein
MEMPDLKSLFSSLKSDANGLEAGIVRRLLDPSAAVNVFLAVAAPDAHLGVLLRVDRHLIPSPNECPGGRGFAIRTEVFKEDDKGTVCFGIFCTDHAFEEVLLPFIYDVVPRVLQADHVKAGVGEFLDTVTLWQRFFSDKQAAVLSIDAQCGLFGELLILRELIIPAIGSAAAVSGWKGSESAPQDFRFRGTAIEVKSTRAKAGFRIPIANELQLDSRPFRHLALAYIGLHLAGLPNPNLGSIIGDIRSILSGHGAVIDEFDSKLIRAGWLDAFADKYEPNRFFVKEQKFFEVKEGFPRLITGELPQGLAEVTYSVELSALKSFEVPRSLVQGWLKDE